MKALLAAALVSLFSGSVFAMPVEHTYVKLMIERVLGLDHQDVGMQATTISSSDCRIRIVDGSAESSVGGDQAALQVMKNGKTLSFFISDKMTYDVSRGAFLDITSNKKSGLVTHTTLLKMSASKMMITQLSLYPSNNQPQSEKTFSIVCSL